MGCFKELKAYERLIDLPEEAVRSLAVRMYNLLYTQPTHDEHRTVIDSNNARFIQILEELTIMQATEKKLVKSGELVFPAISEKELAFKDDW